MLLREADAMRARLLQWRAERARGARGVRYSRAAMVSMIIRDGDIAAQLLRRSGIVHCLHIDV